jgi:hypothetical protein
MQSIVTEARKTGIRFNFVLMGTSPGWLAGRTAAPPICTLHINTTLAPVLCAILTIAWTTMPLKLVMFCTCYHHVYGGCSRSGCLQRFHANGHHCMHACFKILSMSRGVCGTLTVSRKDIHFTIAVSNSDSLSVLFCCSYTRWCTWHQNWRI